MPNEKRGRPTKLTPEVQEAVVLAIEGGNYIETAAALAGISKETLYDWLRRGAAEEAGIYADFSDALKRALARAEVSDVARIAEASESQWQAAAWRLERRYPDRWGRRERQEPATKSDAAAYDLDKLTDAQLDDLETLLDAARAPESGAGTGTKGPATTH